MLSSKGLWEAHFLLSNTSSQWCGCSLRWVMERVILQSGMDSALFACDNVPFPFLSSPLAASSPEGTDRGSDSDSCKDSARHCCKQGTNAGSQAGLMGSPGTQHEGKMYNHHQKRWSEMALLLSSGGYMDPMYWWSFEFFFFSIINEHLCLDNCLVYCTKEYKLNLSVY